uniref:Uncharacterized protein n=1 Tax=Triticum urartu TaxID=4572 RepID=A0A8R7THW9_TRIUA
MRKCCCCPPADVVQLSNLEMRIIVTHHLS